MDRFVFLTGMFRSGTTLLARMLNVHPKLAIASDPYALLFKAFRNAVAEKIFDKQNIDFNAPLDDYYFYPEKQKLMGSIQETNLAMPIGDLRLSDLRERIKIASRPYSPKINPLLDDLKGDTFANLLIRGLDIIKRGYGNKNTQLVGFKEVWTNEFAGHLLRQFPGAKIIHIIRDPRAVCASKNVTNEKYPWMFLTRQWRKLATFAWLNIQPWFSFSDRVLLIKFEELITNSLPEAEKICNFLEIEFNENLVNPTTYVNGDGKPWRQNSFHFQGEQKFNTESIDKWRETLTPDEIKFIESLCFVEMKAFDYQFLSLDKTQVPLYEDIKLPEVAKDKLESWIRPYSLVESKALFREMKLEYMRTNRLRDIDYVSDDEKRALCLDEAFFDYGRKLCQK